MRLKYLFTLLLIVTAFTSGCAVNPVTGKNELVLVSKAQEINIGAKQYLPGRQSQGGDYTVDPTITAYVREVGQRLAAVSDRRDLPWEFAVVNDSTPNAWALPGGKIAINRGLLVELDDEAQLAAVLGHEIVHAAARHGAKRVERGMLLQGLMAASAVASRNSRYSSLAVGGAGLVSALIGQSYSREAELEADHYGMIYMARAGYDPAAAVELQRTFLKLAQKRRNDWLSGLFASHPPSQERIDANLRTAASLPGGGQRYRQRYHHRLATLFKDRQAYKLYDDARKSLKDKQLDQALSLARQALRLEPREALFHSLRGDIRFEQQRWNDAIINYNRAIARNPAYFHYYLQRGLSRMHLHRDTLAQDDLQRSIALLPTAPAYTALGQLALNRGQRRRAKDFFAQALKSPSPAGKAARTAYERLDLSDNPQRYIRCQPALDRHGYLVAKIRNHAHAAVNNVVIAVEFTDNGGGRHRVKLRGPQHLPPNSGAIVTTGIGPLHAARQAHITISAVKLPPPAPAKHQLAPTGTQFAY